MSNFKNTIQSIEDTIAKHLDQIESYKRTIRENVLENDKLILSINQDEQKIEEYRKVMRLLRR